MPWLYSNIIACSVPLYVSKIITSYLHEDLSESEGTFEITAKFTY